MRFKVLRSEIGRFYFAANRVISTYDLRYFAIWLPGWEVISITRRENHCLSLNGITCVAANVRRGRTNKRYTEEFVRVNNDYRVNYEIRRRFAKLGRLR